MIGDDDVAFVVAAATTTSSVAARRRFHLLVNATKILQEAKKVATQGLQSPAILIQHGQEESFAHTLQKLPSLDLCKPHVQPKERKVEKQEKEKNHSS